MAKMPAIDPDRVTGPLAFRWRIGRNRWNEFLEHRKKIYQEDARRPPNERLFQRAADAFHTAALEFGYMGDEAEIQYFWQANREAEEKIASEKRKLVQEIRDQRACYEEKLMQLPASDGDFERDWQWIYDHPALTRGPDPFSRDIELTDEDIEDAPSRGAVIMLRYFINNRDKFYKQLLDWMQKRLKARDEHEVAMAKIGRVPGGQSGRSSSYSDPDENDEDLGTLGELLDQNKQ